jgi:hypothetical protein
MTTWQKHVKTENHLPIVTKHIFILWNQTQFKERKYLGNWILLMHIKLTCFDTKLLIEIEKKTRKSNACSNKVFGKVENYYTYLCSINLNMLISSTYLTTHKIKIPALWNSENGNAWPVKKKKKRSRRSLSLPWKIQQIHSIRRCSVSVSK